MSRRLPREVEDEIGSLLSDLNEAGFSPKASLYSPEAFGNWYVDLKGPIGAFRIIKDRSQYIVDGPKTEELEAAGLWRSFDSLDEFGKVLMNWLRSRAGAF